MTFKDAKAELRAMANGEYRSLTYSLTEFDDGTETATCNIYVNPSLSASGATWREALNGMRELLNPTDPKPAGESEAPEPEVCF